MYCQFVWWVDRTYSDINGARFTTNVECGALVLTILTLAVSLAEGAVWTIIAYSMFQILASRKDVAAFRTQIQLILVNPTSSFADWWNLLATGLSWRKHNRKALGTLVLLSSVPLISFIGFSVAHILVSRVTIPSFQTNKFPASSGTNTCGLIDFHRDTLNGLLRSKQHTINATKQAQSYRDQCYHKPSDGISCGGFVTQELNYRASAVDCPWQENLCVIGQAYQLDTGWIDSHDHLGINAKPSDRIKTRIVSTCSVLNATNHLQIIPATQENAPEDWNFYFDNPATAADPTNTYNGGSLTYTHSTVGGKAVDVAYTFESQYFSWDNELGTSGTIPVLDRRDGSLTLLFMSSNNLMYTAPNRDPFFYATQENDVQLPGSSTVYTANSRARVLACLDQVQLQNPNNGETTPLQSSIFGSGNNWTVPDNIYQLGFNEAQNATATRIAKSLTISAVTHWNVAGLYSLGLGASSAVIEGISTGLLDNQWQVEIAGWFDTGLAKLQQTIVNYVENPWLQDGNAAAYMSVIDPKSMGGQDQDAFVQQCSNQLISGIATNQTFSALGVIIIAVIAPLLVILAFVLNKIVRHCSSTHKRNYDIGYRKQNVLRMALEARGYDGWIETQGNVPVRTLDKADIPPPIVHNGHLDIPMAESGRHSRSTSGHTDTIQTSSEEPAKHEENMTVRTSVLEYNSQIPRKPVP